MIRLIHKIRKGGPSMKDSKLRSVNQMLIWGGLVNPYKITIFNRNKDYEVSSFKTSVFS